MAFAVAPRISYGPERVSTSFGSVHKDYRSVIVTWIEKATENRGMAKDCIAELESWSARFGGGLGNHHKCRI